MKSVLIKLIIVTIALIGWVIYTRMDQIKEALDFDLDTSELVANIAPASSPSPTETTIYKWQDDKGDWHMSNSPPVDARNVQIHNYSDNNGGTP